MAHGLTLSASSLIGNEVRNLQDEDIGEIEEIMLDTESGRVSYAVLSFGGILGIGEKLFAIPWDALTLDTEEQLFVLDIDKERLENAPGFNRDNWPQSPSEDDSWLLSVYDYYDTDPYWRH